MSTGADCVSLMGPLTADRTKPSQHLARPGVPYDEILKDMNSRSAGDCHGMIHVAEALYDYREFWPPTR